MSKIKIWQAPFRSLYSLSFYREVLESKLSSGISYLVFLSFLAALVAGVAFNIRSLPEVREFVAWAQATAPPLTYTPEGLQMNAPSPYLMKHPRYGPLVMIDISKTGAAEAKDFQEGNLLLLTAKRGFLRAPSGIRSFDYTPEDKNFAPVPVTGEMYEEFGKTFRRVLIVAIPIGIFCFFFLWKFTIAIAYSGFALFINRFRREPLPYEKVLNLCLFAMTAFILLELATLLIPKFEIRGGFFTGLAVTLLYLAIALLKTETAVPAE